MAELFDALVAAGDTARPKPAPDCYIQLMAKLNVSAGEAVVVEDTEVGVAAARAAQLRAVAFRHELNHDMAFADAHAIVESFSPVERIVEILSTSKHWKPAAPR